jgi:GNAT superfamily N-acetyltransferase
MIILEAKSEDLPEMISLLKMSLGEGLIPKSETYFIWKHFKNPFGISKILLAKEEGKIIGLRAFMYWNWENSIETYSAVRAVDTATHPSFQGKGIFKKLTLEAIEQCKNESVSMVFNTPNPISMQGYLKMNWYLAGKMPIYFGFGSILPQFFKEKNIEKVYNRFDAVLAFNQLDEEWSKKSSNDFLHTTLTKKYLNWRYNQCPILKYGAIVSVGEFGMVFRLKKIGGFIELRICELWSEKKKEWH